MKWIAGILLLVLSALWIVARKEAVPEEVQASTVTKPFYQMAVFLERKLLLHARSGGVIAKLKSVVFRRNEENIRLLDPAGDVATKLHLQFVSKAGLCLLLLAVGILFSIAISISEAQDGMLQEGSALARREYGKGDYSVELTAVIETDAEEASSEQTEVIEVEVLQRSFTEDELRQMLPQFEADLEKAVLAENESADHVCRDLDLVDSLEEYPFSVAWEYNDHSLINRWGALREDIPQEGGLLTLDALIRCGDFEAQHRFSVMVGPKQQNGGERIREQILQALRLADERSRSSDTYILPTEADGIRIVWQEEKKNSFAVLLLLVIAATAAVWWGKDNDLEKQVRERDAQMTADYPEVISKLSLYVGAGMTVRLAWKKMAMEYLRSRKEGLEDVSCKRGKSKKIGRNASDGKRFVYEEMVLTLREMESGISELQAYRHFAKRCRLQKYVKLVSLLEQNVKLGAKGFMESLRKETGEALEERRSRAKSLGEEAGTRLLVPMVLMLAIVMVVIIVPAFMSI